MTDRFVLDQTLEKDSFFIEDLLLCQVRLVNNAHHPWILLIPKVNHIKDITDLSLDQKIHLWSEISQISDLMQALFTPDKLNIASLGNQVPQMHWHLIARFKTDISWPKPVWGNSPMKLYDDIQAKEIIHTLHTALS